MVDARAPPRTTTAAQHECTLSLTARHHMGPVTVTPIASSVVSSYLLELNNPEKKLPRFLSFSGAGAALPPPAAGCSCDAEADGKDDDNGCC
jgi:hypothetical protein